MMINVREEGDVIPNFLQFLQIIGNLKKLKRMGWVRRGITDGESIADHMYRMAVMFMVMPESWIQGADRSKCIEMALVHDMAEAIVGDITPECGISSSEKHRLEDSAMAEMCLLLPTEIGARIKSLFEEYNKASTKEAQLVKQIDKLEFLIQTREYEKSRGVCLEEFFDNTRSMIKDQGFKDMLAHLDKPDELLHSQK